MITVDMVEHYLGRTLDVDETYAASVVFLPMVTAETESFIGRPLTVREVESTARGVYPEPGHDLRLAASPVIEVASVTVDGTTLEPTSYITHTWGIEFRQQFTAPATVVVDYTAGLDPTIPGYDAIRSVICARVVRMLERRSDDAHAVTRIGVEGYSVNYIDDGWTDHEQAILARYKRRVVA